MGTKVSRRLEVGYDATTEIELHFAHILCPVGWMESRISLVGPFLLELVLPESKLAPSLLDN